ncbi:MAG: glycosyltransferase family 2 protein [Vicinamibacterales bacterium]
MSLAWSVIVVNFNSTAHLSRSLESIRQCLCQFEWEAVVVDNASSDRSPDLHRTVSQFDRVRVIRNPTNVGFAAAVNQGLSATTAPLVLLLNPDCFLCADAPRLLAQELDAHPDCGIVGPGLLGEDGSLQGSARGDPNMLTGLFGRSTMLTRVFPQVPVAQRNVRTLDARALDSDGSVVVDWVSGACLLARRDTFARVGGFDSRFFLYWEDADFCRRARSAGLATRFVPAARAVHLVGQSSRSDAALSIRAFHASAYRYYVKHVGPSWMHRVAAKALLSLRCRWKLLTARPPVGVGGINTPVGAPSQVRSRPGTGRDASTRVDARELGHAREFGDARELSDAGGLRR